MEGSLEKDEMGQGQDVDQSREDDPGGVENGSGAHKVSGGLAWRHCPSRALGSLVLPDSSPHP